MIGAVGGLFVQLITASIVFGVNVFFTLTASLIRSLPWLVPLVARLTWRWLLFTCRLYVWALTPLQPVLRRGLRINLLARTPRRIATILLSLCAGMVILLLFQSPFQLWRWIAGVPFGVWLLALCILHGWLVDRIWDSFPDDSGLHMGERI